MAMTPKIESACQPQDLSPSHAQNLKLTENPHPTQIDVMFGISASLPWPTQREDEPLSHVIADMSLLRWHRLTAAIDQQ